MTMPKKDRASVVRGMGLLKRSRRPVYSPAASGETGGGASSGRDPEDPATSDVRFPPRPPRRMTSNEPLQRADVRLRHDRDRGSPGQQGGLPAGEDDDRT